MNMKPMEENNSQLLEYTMRAGLLLGIFWSLKYLLTIFGMNNPIINSIGTLLSLGTPVLLFYFLVKYNREWLDDKMRYGQGVRFSILLFFFASILEAMVVFVHVRWIDTAFIANLFGNLIEMAETLALSKTLTAQLAEQPLPDPFSYTFSNVIMADVFLGLVLSLLIVPLAIRFSSRPSK